MSNITVTTSFSNVQVSPSNANVINVTTTPSNISISAGTILDPALVRSLLSNTAPILYDTANGIIGFDSNASFTGKTTDDLSEGSTNLYFTAGRANTAITDFDGVLTPSSLTASGNVQGVTLKGTGTIGLIVNGNATIGGNLDVTGNINSETVVDLFVEDRNITLQYGATGTPSANSQLFVDRGSSSNTYIKWDETGDSWKFSNDGSTEYKIAVSTSDLAEGTNLYFTNARADARADAVFNAQSTSNLTEGTNLYYTTARANSAIQDQLDSYTNIISSNANITTTANIQGGNIIGTINSTSEISSPGFTIPAVSGYGEGSYPSTYPSFTMQHAYSNVTLQNTLAYSRGIFEENGIVAFSKDGNVNNIPGQMAITTNNLYTPNFSTGRFGPGSYFGDQNIKNRAIFFGQFFKDSIDGGIWSGGPDSGGSGRFLSNVAANGSRTPGNYSNVLIRQGSSVSGNGALINVNVEANGNVKWANVVQHTGGVDYLPGNTYVILDSELGGGGAPDISIDLTTNYTDVLKNDPAIYYDAEESKKWRVFAKELGAGGLSGVVTEPLLQGTASMVLAHPETGDITLDSNANLTMTSNSVLTIGQGFGTGIITLSNNEFVANSLASGFKISNTAITCNASPISSNSNITTTANISGGNILGTHRGAIDSTSNITTTANISGGSILGTFIGNITGNVTGAPSSLAGLTTADLAENTNLYYTDARFDTRLATKSTSDLTEGTNLYYTTARANTAIGAYTGNLTAVNTTGNITTTANISGGNLLTDHVISASGQPLQLKGQTDGIELDKTISSAETRIVDIDTTGYGVASADFHTSVPVGTNVPGLFVNLTITSGSADVTINTMHAAGLYAIGQTSAGYTSYGAFGQANFTNAVAALNGALSASMQTKGWSLFSFTGGAIDTNFPIGTFVTGVSGATMTMSKTATSSGTSQSYILIPGAYSTTQDLGFVVSNTGAGSLPFSHIAVNNYVASLPETLSNVTLDAVSHATSVNLANVVTRHIADLNVGALSAVRINQALLIGANATPDVTSIGVGSASPSEASILGLTLEADGVTTYPTANATPQTKFLINQYTDNSVKALTAVPNWASAFASGNATLDNNQLGAPAFNFKLLNGNKDNRANLEVVGKSVVGKISWNAVSDGTASGFVSGVDTIYPPASMTVMVQDDVIQTSNISALDYYIGTTYPTSYRNGADVNSGGIARTFIANKEGNTVIAAKTDGKVTLRPVRDYGDTGTDTSFVQNRYPNELHEYHEFLGAGFLGSKAGTLVEIQPKSGETGGSSNFNYDSKGDATLRLSSHHANNAVKAQWDITNDESESTLIVRDHTNSATKLEFSALRTEFSTSAKLKNYTTTQINALSSPEAGDIVFNTTLELVCVYNGSAWRKLNDAAM